MARRDIEAGRAFVTLSLKSTLGQGLRRAQQRLNDFGRAATSVGGALTGMGTAALGGLAGMVRQFSKVGDQLDKMSGRTGVSGTALAELGFAAEQSGASIETIENALRAMSRTLGNAVAGTAAFDGIAVKSDAASKSLAELGLRTADIAKMSPEDQFMLLADRMSRIENPTQRAAQAMKIFGRQGTQLLPLLANGAEGIEKLRAEARDLGLAPSSEAIGAAAQVTDAINRVSRSVKAIVFEIGAALAPAVLDVLDTAKNVISTVRQWVAQNAALVRTLAMVAVGVTVVGGIITAVGLGFLTLGAAIGGVLSAFSAVAAVVGAVLSPLGLVVATLAAGVLAFANFTEAGQSAVRSLTSGLSGLWDIAKTTFGGIRDALTAGDIAAAGHIAITSLRLVFMKGLDALFGSWIDTFANLWKKTTETFGGIRTAFVRFIEYLSPVWDSFATGMADAMIMAANSFASAWQQSIASVAKGIVHWQNELYRLGLEIQTIIDAWKVMTRQMTLQEAALRRRTGETGLALLQDTSPMRSGALEQQIALTTQAAASVVSQRIRDALAAGASAFDGGGSTGATGGRFGSAIAELEADLARSAAEAKTRAVAVREAREAAAGASPDSLEAIKKAAKGGTAGSFSGAALAALGRGGGDQPIVKTLRQQILIQQNQLKAIERLERKTEAKAVFV